MTVETSALNHAGAICTERRSGFAVAFTVTDTERAREEREALKRACFLYDWEGKTSTMMAAHEADEAQWDEFLVDPPCISEAVSNFFQFKLAQRYLITQALLQNTLAMG